MSNPVVLITGALTGIGRAAAVAFARKGAKVVVAGRRDEAGKALVKELRSLGSEAEFINTDVRKDVLTDSWTPSNPNAKYPILEGSLDPFSHSVSSFYLESGSYVRMRALQIGFTPPAGFVRWIPAQRIYLQAENLFTITGYPGLDPSLPSANIYGASGDLRDQYMGVDRGNYPSNRTFTIGITTTF